MLFDHVYGDKWWNYIQNFKETEAQIIHGTIQTKPAMKTTVRRDELSREAAVKTVTNGDTTD
jgi:hypothetical protein